eukprot:GDKH01009117.1.p6 GENE.GDKH01009117.1~~GDKH01009117.1.p6  ORF type:complete len:64 (-),score=7.73 GDKH01009117.1:281-472(-)
MASDHFRLRTWEEEAEGLEWLGVGMRMRLLESSWGKRGTWWTSCPSWENLQRFSIFAHLMSHP